MKRFIVLLTVVAVMLTCSTAFATETLYEHVGGKYTVTYDGTANEMYGFVVVGPTTVGEGEEATTEYHSNFTSSSILYIDQQTANSAGKVEFKNFMLKEGATPDANNYLGRVFIGGGEASALSLGYVTSVEKVITGVNVTGTITDTNNPREATVTLKDAEGETVGTANTVSGAYSIAEVMPGTYSLEIAKTASCSLTYSNVVVGEEDVTVDATTTKYAGDVDSTNEINGYDLRTVITDFNKVSGTHTFANPNADADASGTVNGYDLRVIIANFNQKGETKSL